MRVGNNYVRRRIINKNFFPIQFKYETLKPNRMNYDFKTNWERIRPLLKSPILQKAMRQSINAYLKCRGDTYKYSKNRLPYQYSKVDNLFCYDIEEKVIEDLLQWGIIKEDPILTKLKENSNDDDLDEYYDSDEYAEWQESIRPIAELYIRDRLEKNYQSYCLYGGCFWYNKNFGLKLAKIVMPSVDWVVKRSNIHSTVISTDGKLVFDILYFDENEADFGGRKAINDTNNMISWEEHHALERDIHNKKMSKKKLAELINVRDRMYNPKYIEASI